MADQIVIPALPTPPQPPPANVERVDASGKPTVAQVTYERKILEWQKAMADAMKYALAMGS